jgi:putative ABC transport system permease protein
LLAGVVTGVLHTKLKIPALLAGILTMIGLYSVNLRIMGKANLSMLGMDTVFTYMQKLTGFTNSMTVFCVGLISCIFIGVIYTGSSVQKLVALFVLPVLTNK